MNKPNTVQKKESYISTELDTYNIDNSRKIVISESYHNGKQYIDLMNTILINQSKRAFFK
jgi:hypothetical protein